MLSLIAVCAAGTPVLGQAAPGSDAPQVTAVQRLGTIKVDGRLDDAAWLRAMPATGFRQQDPDEGRPAAESTQVRFVYDGDALYVGARMFDSRGAAGVRSRLARRDEQPGGDYLMLVLDTYHDHAGRTVLRINPSGVQYDALALGRADPDPGWNAVWEAATRIDSLGWTAELRIPFSQLRLAGSGAQTWGLQIWRYEDRRKETSQWAFWTKHEPGGPAYFGHLTGLVPEQDVVTVEASPYVALGIAPRVPDSGSGTAVYRTHETHAMGADVLLRAPGTSATVTLNPDFGQVEADPAVLNLTASETFFPEKRPFFVQDAGIFGFGAIDCAICAYASPLDLYYSRRIGHPPSLHPSGLVIDAPSATQILGAARATFQSRNGWTAGALVARTDRETATVLDSSGQAESVAVEPSTTYLIGRAEKSATSGAGAVGVIGTLTDRSMTSRSVDALGSLLAARAATVGVDGERWWSNHTYRAGFTSAVSSIAGDSLALQHIQTSSVHYFQRPGRHSTAGLFDSRYDSGRTELNGYASVARVAKEGGVWTWEAIAELVSPGFEVNDLGFMPIAGTQWILANVRRNFTVPTSWYHSAQLVAGTEQRRNFDGDATGRAYYVSASVVTPSYWTADAIFIHRLAHYDDRMLRGGPTVAVGAGDSVGFDVESDTRHNVSIADTTWWSSDRSGNGSAGIAQGLSLRPTDGTSLSASVRAAWLNAGAQFVASVPNPGTQTQKRYVVASLTQRTVALEFRAATAITRTLSLDAYLQPFVTAGVYRDFGEFAGPRSDTRLIYGRDMGSLRRTPNGDGNWISIAPGDSYGTLFSIRDPTGGMRSLHGTAVLRWEYRPGMALYLAWTQTRSDLAPDGTLDLQRDGRALLAAHPENALLFKVAYLMGR
jgi:plastocyanin